MAPEQAMGQSDLDGRVDIYATGCVAYWLLTGQTVFTSETTMGLLMHLVTRPRRRRRPAASAGPAALDSLVLSCLAKDPTIGRNRPGRCRADSPRSAAQPRGPRIARADGGRSISQSGQICR